MIYFKVLSALFTRDAHVVDTGTFRTTRYDKKECKLHSSFGSNTCHKLQKGEVKQWYIVSWQARCNANTSLHEMLSWHSTKQITLTGAVGLKQIYKLISQLFSLLFLSICLIKCILNCLHYINSHGLFIFLPGHLIQYNNNFYVYERILQPISSQIILLINRFYVYRTEIFYYSLVYLLLISLRKLACLFIAVYTHTVLYQWCERICKHVISELIIINLIYALYETTPWQYHATAVLIRS